MSQYDYADEGVASYLHRLQNSTGDARDQIDDDDSIHVGGYHADEPPMSQQSRTSTQTPPPIDPSLGSVDPDITNRILEPERIFALDQASRQQLVGESTCLAFGDRILQCLNPQSTTPPLPPGHQYVRNPVFARQLHSVTGCKFPERIRANLLVRVALRFIGQDYHLFLHHDFLDKFNNAYSSGQNSEDDAVWICKFFVILALGEMYSTSLPAAKEARPSSVPGTGYFLTAVGLLQDLFEEPSIAQIETLLLFVSHSVLLIRYSNALGQPNVRALLSVTH